MSLPRDVIDALGAVVEHLDTAVDPLTQSPTCGAFRCAGPSGRSNAADCGVGPSHPGLVWRLVLPAGGALQQRLHAVDKHCDALLERFVAFRGSAFADSRHQGGGVLDRRVW